MVYTTDPDEARRLRNSGAMPATRDSPPAEQTIRVSVDRKRRKGKTVTVAAGFRLTADSLEKIARGLKQRCAAGGTLTSEEIEIQGDHARVVSEHLVSLGFKVRKV